MKWIKCSEKMPHDNQYVLVIDKNNEIWTAQWFLQSKSNPPEHFWIFKVANDDCCGCTWPELDNETVTHWMPLPPAPCESQCKSKCLRCKN